MESLTRVLYSLHRGTPQHGPWVVACLEGAWSHILGESLAKACRPVHFSNSELVIEILDPAWDQTLRDISRDIGAKLRKATGGEVGQVKFVTDSSRSRITSSY